MKPFKIKKKERGISVRMPEIREKLPPPKLPKKLFTKNVHEASAPEPPMSGDYEEIT